MMHGMRYIPIKSAQKCGGSSADAVFIRFRFISANNYVLTKKRSCDIIRLDEFLLYRSNGYEFFYKR